MNETGRVDKAGRAAGRRSLTRTGDSVLVVGSPSQQVMLSRVARTASLSRPAMQRR